MVSASTVVLCCVLFRSSGRKSTDPMGHRVGPGSGRHEAHSRGWDAAGLYQVGSFVGDSWKEWNGRFRDARSRLFRGDFDLVVRLADRLLGSPEIYGHEEREPEQTVNFVTCHDGLTLNDLGILNDRKHNEANGEDNRDGADDNRSWNCGWEGPTHGAGGREQL